MNIIDKIGRMVKARTAHLPPADSELVERGLSDVVRLDADPELLRQVEILRDSSDWTERIGAWESVREMGPSVSGWEWALRELIQQGDGWGQIFAAESLAWHTCCEYEAVPVLQAALATTLELNSYDWSRLACGAIGRYENLARPLIIRSRPTVLAALDAEDANVQGYAAKALGNWGRESRQALVKLADLHDRAEEPLRSHFLEMMQKIDPTITSSQNARVRALDDQDAAVRATAVTAMVRDGSRDEYFLPHLLSLFRDENPEVRRNLALGLGEMRAGSEESRMRLKQLATDNDPTVRLAAAYALVRLTVDPDENLKLLRDALQSDVAQLRLLAAWTIGEVGDYSPWRCKKALAGARRKEGREEIREMMTLALQKLGRW